MGVEEEREGMGDVRSLPRLQKVALRLMTRVHTVAYRISGGKLFASVPGPGGRKNPVLLLGAVGRKSGKERTVPLIFLNDDGDFVVVASGGGPDRDPPWVSNALSAGKARAWVGGGETEVFPERVTGEERARLWPGLTRMFPRWEQMQSHTTRELSVIRLRTNARRDHTHREDNP